MPLDIGWVFNIGPGRCFYSRHKWRDADEDSSGNATMSELSNTFLFVFAGLFPVVNPLGSAPLFLSLTSGCEPRERNQLALGVALNSFWLLLGSMLFGSVILEFFGITLPVVRVAGGMLVTAMGWRMFSESSGSRQDAGRESEKPEEIIDSFYPLTLPLTVGPGAISVALTIGSHRPRDEFSTHAMLIMGSALVGLLAISLAVYVSYRFAASLVRSLGQGGVNVLIRLSAFILVCIGIQITWGGLSDLIREIHRSLLLS
jgi:multiple antibiotic resistance protein